MLSHLRKVRVVGLAVPGFDVGAARRAVILLPAVKAPLCPTRARHLAESISFAGGAKCDHFATWIRAVLEARRTLDERLEAPTVILLDGSGFEEFTEYGRRHH